MRTLEHKTWKPVLSYGAVPSGRYSHCTAVVHNQLYVFGGQDGSRWYNDVYVFDLGKKKIL